MVLRIFTSAAVLAIALFCATSVQAGAESEGKKILEYCKSLYSDPRLDILRARTAFNAQDLTAEHFMQDVFPSDAEIAVFPISRAYGQQCKKLTMDLLSKYAPSTVPVMEMAAFRGDLVWAALAKKQITWTNANFLRKQAWLESYQQATNALLAEEERARQRWAAAADALNDAARALGPTQTPQATTTWCRWVGTTFSCTQF